MKMHVLSGGRLRMKKNVYVPVAGKDELVDLPVMCFLLRHAQGNVLFDTGCHPSIAETPEERWGGMAKFMVPLHGRGENVVDELGTLGIRPEDIDVVVNSHLHTDHCGCNAFFTRATFIAHADEVATAKAPDAGKKGYVAADWDLPMQLDPITAQRDVFGDGRIVLVPVPGHTPGSTGALVALDKSGAFFLASDAVALGEILEHDYQARNNWNQEQALQSMAEIRRIRAQGATVIYGHDLAQWDALQKGAQAYE
jgi:glyoxylase-like metal-dependent hydrolase (beta-lactamase superfamily II)